MAIFLTRTRATSVSGVGSSLSYLPSYSSPLSALLFGYWSSSLANTSSSTRRKSTKTNSSKKSKPCRLNSITPKSPTERFWAYRLPLSAVVPLQRFQMRVPLLLKPLKKAKKGRRSQSIPASQDAPRSIRNTRLLNPAASSWTRMPRTSPSTNSARDSVYSPLARCAFITPRKRSALYSPLWVLPRSSSSKVSPVPVKLPCLTA